MKKQTLILVLIGVILFVAGSVIAYASVRGATKHAGADTQAPVTTSAVVATANIPAGMFALATTADVVTGAWVSVPACLVAPRTLA